MYVDPVPRDVSRTQDVERGRERAPSLALVRRPAAHAHAERIIALDGLRGVMAWAVALYHFGMLARTWQGGSWAASVIAVLGLHSVEAFFIVSGFCLFYLHGDMQLSRAGLARFYWQRFVRIAPLYYLALVLHQLAGTPAGPSFSWGLLLENLTLTFGAHHPNRSMVIGGWSIGLELLFYAAFPPLALLLRSLRALACAAVAATVIAWSYSAVALDDAADPSRFNAYVALQNHAFAFLVGGVIAKLRRLSSARISLALAASVAAAVVAAWIATRPRVFDHFEVVLGFERAAYVAASALLVALFAFSDGRHPRAQRLLAELGALSYPVYLLHPLAWVICRGALPEGTGPASMLAALLATTFALALAAFHLYERPLRQHFGARSPVRAVRLLP